MRIYFVLCFTLALVSLTQAKGYGKKGSTGPKRVPPPRTMKYCQVSSKITTFLNQFRSIEIPKGRDGFRSIGISKGRDGLRGIQKRSAVSYRVNADTVMHFGDVTSWVNVLTVNGTLKADMHVTS
jgi:hypothetical protein